MSVYEKTWIRGQNNIEHQIVDVVLLTHYGFNIEISKMFEFKSTLFVLFYNLKIQRLSNTGTRVDSTATRC